MTTPISRPPGHALYPTTVPAPDSNRVESLIEYPSLFPIKVMGVKAEGFVEAMTAIATEHDPSFELGRLEMRDSSGGKYQSLTLTVTATSREQLDNLYRALTAHPQAKYVL
jgi:putative lipoic acid-binding regulatory protein